MKLKLLLGISFWMLVFVVSCNSDDITFDSPSAELRFSSDTLFCDTVYNQTRSETYAVKVYNREDKDISIPKISLEGGASSPYRINVDGTAGTEFTNIPLRKKDSLYIFVEIAPVANAPEAIAEDRIVFDSPVGQQHVTLLSVVQDAEYFIQNDSNPNILTSNTVWNNDKAKVIYGNLTLAEGKTLNIQAGTKVYFTKNSSLTVAKNATVNVSGELDKEVIFRGDRSDTKYDTIPMNWKGITFDEGATLNMNYAKVFGGETGISLDNATATIQNSIIHSFQNFGIYAIASVIHASNLVMNNCGQADFAMLKGGSADLNHCTLANFWDLNASLPAYSIYASNELTDGDGNTVDGPLHLKIRNSVVFGDKDTAMYFSPVSGQTFEYSVDSSLLNIGDHSGFSFENNTSITNSLNKEDPKFLNYYIQKMNLRVADDSPAKGLGNITAAQLVPKDIKGMGRTVYPTAGAYQ
ncbi:hypothetical protein [Daejeonia sp. YH14]|uniref:hypothetical protein n=1 Tax=Daejeonia sp. YH14 TaxID=3439042 RepID=UPI003F4996F6